MTLAVRTASGHSSNNNASYSIGDVDCAFRTIQKNSEAVQYISAKNHLVTLCVSDDLDGGQTKPSDFQIHPISAYSARFSPLTSQRLPIHRSKRR